MADSSSIPRFVVKALSSPPAAAALDGLVQSGCDRDELLQLLGRLRRAEMKRIRSKKTLKKLARTLERASTGVIELTDWRELPNLGLSDDPRTWLLSCSHDLKLLAEAIRTRTAAEGKQVSPRLSLARKRLVDRVQEWTGQSHDEQLAVVMAAVLDWKSFGPEEHAKWRAALPLDSAP